MSHLCHRIVVTVSSYWVMHSRAQIHDGRFFVIAITAHHASSHQNKAASLRQEDTPRRLGVLAKGLMFPQGAEWDRLAPLTEQTTTRWTRSTEEQLVSRAGLSVTASVNCGFLASCNPDIPASPLHWEDGMTNSWSSFCRWTGVVFTDETTDDKLNK